MTEEAWNERNRIDEELSVELRPDDEPLPEHGIKPPSFWRGPAGGGIDITSVEVLASAMGGRRKQR